MADFISFNKIEYFDTLQMCITQKINGTNGQIYIGKDGEVLVGNRNRWLSIEDDNHGFCAFVEKNKSEIIETLGPGRHFGEFCGGNISTGEGLKNKTFVLFDTVSYKDKELPSIIKVVPVLYKGKLDIEAVYLALSALKHWGSLLSPGYMHVEGIVIQIGSKSYKCVFDKQETGWWSNKESRDRKVNEPKIDITHLLQPLRLQKLIGRDEKYIRDYPESMKQIFSDYVQDLVDEKQIDTEDEDFKLIKKELGAQLFKFIKVNIHGYS